MPHTAFYDLKPSFDRHQLYFFSKVKAPKFYNPDLKYFSHLVPTTSEQLEHSWNISTIENKPSYLCPLPKWAPIYMRYRQIMCTSL